MAYQKKYYYNFFGLNNQTGYTTEIWQNTTDTLTAIQIIGDKKPFVVTYPKVKNKFETILGSGCDLNLLSTSASMFFNLYTSDMMEYQIRFYHGDNLIWIGYLNSELYSEPFSESKNYSVSLTGNDGLALLERLDYLQSDGTDFTGFSTNWNVITNVLSKLGLGWNKIYVSLSTTSSELTIGSSDTILTKTYSYNENYYTEDEVDNAMNCKEVLETILKPFSATIQIVNGNIYIIDTNTLAAGGNQTFRRYNGTTFAYETNETINLSLGDISTIKVADSNQTLNIISSINKQMIRFSPYVNKNNVEFIDYDASKDIFSGSPEVLYFGTLPYTWYETEYPYSTKWSKFDSTNLGLTRSKFSVLTGTNNNQGEIDYYLTIGSLNTPLSSDGSIFTYTGTLPSIITSTIKKYYLKVNAKCYVRTTDNMGDESSVVAYQCKIKTNLVIGDKKYRWDADFGSSSGWYPANEPQHHLVMNFTSMGKTEKSYEMISISDKWVDCTTGYIDVDFDGGNTYTYQIRKPDSIFVPLDIVTVGNTFSFGIGGYQVFNDDANRVNITSQIKDVRIKDIKLTICDEKFNEIELKDIEHQYWVNKNIKDDAGDISLKLGTNISYNPLAIGGILKNTSGSYSYIQSFTRGGTTGILEHLLARSIVSNYNTKTIEIECAINNIDSVFGVLTYNNYLTGNFAIEGSVIDYSEQTIDLSMQQISIDDSNLNLNEII